jgi:predicted nucleic acid-binding protein
VRLYFDTSIFVAAFIQTHTENTRALNLLRAASPHDVFISAHGLAEIYSTLTRYPVKPKMPPDKAFQIIIENILSSMTVVTVSAEDYQSILETCVRKKQVGGKIFDAIHLAAALKMECDKLYTFNAKDFLALAPDNFRSKIVSS